MTKSSVHCMVSFVSRCWSTESLSWLMVCTILCLSVFCICFCLCFFYILFFSIVSALRCILLREASPVCGGLFLSLVVIVVPDVIVAVEVRFFCICVYEPCKGFDKVHRIGLYVGLFWLW